MLIIKMDIQLHALCYSGRNELFDSGFFLCTEPPFLSIMSLPLGGEEVREAAQPLSLPLDLAFSLAKTAQPIVRFAAEPKGQYVKGL